MGEQRRIVLDELGPEDGLTLVDLVTRARLVCFPTDTLYGIGGPLKPSVGDLVYRIKRRDRSQPLQVLFPSVETLVDTVSMGRRTLDAVRGLLPGGLTILLPYPQGFDYPPPGRIEGGGLLHRRQIETLGVRVPRWPVAARLLGALSFPLLGSSANTSGSPSPATLDEVDPEIRSACDLLLDAGPVGGRPSTLLDLTSYEDANDWRVIRSGAVSEDQVRGMLERKRDDLSG